HSRTPVARNPHSHVGRPRQNDVAEVIHTAHRTPVYGGDDIPTRQPGPGGWTAGHDLEGQGAYRRGSAEQMSHLQAKVARHDADPGTMRVSVPENIGDAPLDDVGGHREADPRAARDERG